MKTQVINSDSIKTILLFSFFLCCIPFITNVYGSHTAPQALDTKSEQKPECSICLEEFNDDHIVTLLQTCSHVFHTHCIEDKRISNCPLCCGEKIMDPHFTSKKWEDVKGLIRNPEEYRQEYQDSIEIVTKMSDTFFDQATPDEQNNALNDAEAYCLQQQTYNGFLSPFHHCKRFKSQVAIRLSAKLKQPVDVIYSLFF